MYKVIRAFCDSQDGNRLYNIGDAFPTVGMKVSKARVKSLLDGSNKNGKVYLEEITDPEDKREDAPEDNPGGDSEGKTED